MPKEIKDFKKENAGRSMTEMLGVLAIIGVLSLGGIIGYKLAMNRYAANQIAYEINMMKTDAKVKIMQGNDTLTLGQPYDGGTIRFGDYGTTFGCSFIKDADDESVVEEAATCQVANAYKIVLKNIPESICKPLANLINNMNDLIAFDINLKENEEVGEGGDCQEGDNVLNAVFSAEPGDLEVLKCEKKEDCPEDLYCHNHLCVECETHEHCQKKGNDYCADNTCHDCKDNQIFDATFGCVECTEDTHCPNPTPICNKDKHVCMACSSPNECQTKNPAAGICTQSGACCEAEGMVWRDGQCTCPDDYKESLTSSGKTVCLPYCKDKDNIGVILMTDTSNSMTLQMFENANKAKEALHIPEDIPSAVYWCAPCYDENCWKNIPSGPVNERLSYGKHSVNEIRAALQTDVSDRLKKTGDFGGSIYEIMNYCSTIKEKLIIIVWWDNQAPGNTGNDIPAFQKLKEKCPETVIYNISPNAKSFIGADKSFNLDDITSEYVEVLNNVLKERSCIDERE